jgi:hypothetical protein
VAVDALEEGGVGAEDGGLSRQVGFLLGDCVEAGFGVGAGLCQLASVRGWIGRSLRSLQPALDESVLRHLA